MTRPHPLDVIHGRFQPLHLRHLEYLLARAARRETLVVGITNRQRGIDARIRR